MWCCLRSPAVESEGVSQEIDSQEPFRTWRLEELKRDASRPKPRSPAMIAWCNEMDRQSESLFDTLEEIARLARK